MGDGDYQKVEVKSEAESEVPKRNEKRVERKLTQHNLFLPDNFKSFIVDSTKAFDHIVKVFRQDVQDFRILAVDTETARTTSPGTTNCINLLQIGTLNGRAFLFRLDMIKTSEINYLRNILADPTITKIGSLFQSNARHLANDWNIYITNWIDVQNVALNCLDKRLVGKSQGLKNMTKTFTGVELEAFNPDILGNWAAEELSDSQINYAARSVMAVMDIFCSIYANRVKISTISCDLIKQHVAWSRFCNNAFYSAFL